MKELLIPVGNMESLTVAVLSGADAVYLAGKRFGARAYATNFNDDEIIEVIKFCHLYGVKIYITVNTLIHESEIESVIDYIKFLHINGVDAIIVQDIGIISILRSILPNLEIHASTQVHTTNEETIKVLSNLGVKRVVLAREVSIDEVNNFTTNMELEAFIHGALCISYSGQCLASSMMMNRSGNRGECAGICRLPFKLKENDTIIESEDKYLLSTKELNTSSNIKEILDSKIYSLKVEGRMKSSEYVGCVTKLYRNLLDKYYKGQELTLEKEIINDLSIIYNREYTKGFILNENNKDIINMKSPNHLGVYLGKVEKVDKKYIYIKINKDVYQGDGIRFIRSNDGGILNYIYDNNYLLTNNCLKDNILIIDNKYDAKVNDIVNITSSIKLVEKYTKNLSRLIPIDMKFTAKHDKEVLLTIWDSNNKIEVKGSICDKAINRATREEEVIEKLSKLGETPFKISNINIDIDDDLFINMSMINKLRQEAISKLIELRSNYKKEVIINEVKDTNNINNDIKGISILVRNEKQLLYVIDKVDRVITEDIKLYNKYKDNKKIYFKASKIGKNTNQDNLLITNLSNINSNGIIDYNLNITNHYSINYFSNYSNLLTLSVELNDDEIERICSYYNNKTNLEIFIYGRIELMLLKYCILNNIINDKSICNVCLNNNKYYLIDRNNNELPIINNYLDHTTHILNSHIRNRIDKIDYYKSLGINNFRIELFDEDTNDIDLILNEVNKYYEI